MKREALQSNLPWSRVLEGNSDKTHCKKMALQCANNGECSFPTQPFLGSCRSVAFKWPLTHSSTER